MQLRVVRDGRAGWASTNRISDDGLAELARRAEAAAASAPVDPDFPGLAEPAPLPAVEGFDEETAALGPEEQAQLARAAIAAAPRHELYGFFTSGVTELALASTTGMSAAQRLTDATVLALAAGEGESGYASATAWAAGSVDPAAVAREAAENVEPHVRSSQPRPRELPRRAGAVRPRRAARLLRVRHVQRAQPARGAQLLHRPRSVSGSSTRR